MKNNHSTSRFTMILGIGLLLLAGLSSRTFGDEIKTSGDKKIGVLLVNHGSRSETWRKSLLTLEDNVRPALLADGSIKGVKTAFMEYTEPSIATRLKEFDADGYTDIIVVPVFLTVSPHTFDDIPTILGKKIDPQSLEMLKLEKIERYSPKANVVITPNLDFPGVLKENILRRAKMLSTDPANEGLVLIAYGDETYEKEWAALLAHVDDYVKTNTGIEGYSYGWCGHVAHYDSAKTTKAVEEVLQSKQKAVVIPVLVAHDENFQIKIIGGGISKVPDNQTRVAYRPDSILPDANIEKWVIKVSHQYAAEIERGQMASARLNP